MGVKAFNECRNLSQLTGLKGEMFSEGRLTPMVGVCACSRVLLVAWDPISS